MNADDTLNYMEKIITGNPAAHNTGWTREINRRAADVRKEITRLNKAAIYFGMYANKPEQAQFCSSRAAFLEDRLNELLTIYQNQEG